MLFGDLTYQEIKACAEKGYLAVVPTGCTEQQGPHLPVDFDTWFAETLCLAGVSRLAHRYGLKALVLPAMPFGPTPEHRNFGHGYIDLPPSVHQDAVVAVLESLAAQGFTRLIIWRGCGGHDLAEVVAQFNRQYAGQAQAIQPEFPYHAIWCNIGDPNVPGGHADSFATSIALHLRPEAVRIDKIANPHNLDVHWDDPKLDFVKYSTTGVIGDPTHASAELGQKLWVSLIDKIAAIFYQIAQD